MHDNLFILLPQCPGKMARDFRRTAAVTLCRLLRGDLTLVDEIQQRHSDVQGTDLDRFLARSEDDRPGRSVGQTSLDRPRDRSRDRSGDRSGGMLRHTDSCFITLTPASSH